MATLYLGRTENAGEVSLSARRLLSEQQGIVAPFPAFDGALWVRVSAQIYNAPQDYTRISAALPALLSELNVR